MDDVKDKPAAPATPETQPEAKPPATPDVKPEPDITDIKAAARTEFQAKLRERNTVIKTRYDALAKANPTSAEQLRAVFDTAISDTETTIDVFTDRALAALVDQGPVAGARNVRVDAGVDESEKRREAVSASLMARAGIPGEDGKPLGMSGNPFRGHSLMDLARDAVARTGTRVEGMTKMDIVGAAFTQSTSDFPILLENTMRKTLQSSFAIAPDTWRRFCAVGSVSDFRAHVRYRIGSLGDLVKVNELAEYTNKPIPDGARQSVIVETYGDIINLSRQAIINDDIGAFVGLTAARGRAAARTIENTVYAALRLNDGFGPVLADGKSIVHADHGNIAAVTTAPSVLSLESALLAMGAQMDINGNDYLDLDPEILLVPKGLELSARILNTAAFDPAITATKNPNTPNPYQNFFREIIGTPRLTGTAWYAFANPAIAPVLEVSFLDGVQEPAMEMERGFDVDGARWKTRLDFGVSAVGYEGVIYNPGATG